MVDCFDRIAVQMTELALEPVRLLRERAMLGAVSLRTPSGGKRYLVTIAKRFPIDDSTATYSWTVAEIDLVGDPIPGTSPITSNPDAPYSDPEAAYWAAVNGMCGVTTGTT